ncbi:FadR/GntR family transcriptional regulator [Rhizobium sp. CSW-27]|uniref:FadR/GntR family transcriptional regulator n=1 Tax=Rhizobium sp. CSW-27 TaxID=2839985 RepID=UPI001C032412|nr:FadR/GntR family transcriptional regulator [Rhizobium sp. CSW-27]MBT9371646.1 FadR family transcriptional regulator [Rhizobium sp. CSW-27]
MVRMPASGEGTRKPRLAAAVIAQLRSDIAAGRLPAGARLPTEPGLVERFGVSRTVIREALAELRAAGLVKAEHGRGVFVCEALPAVDPLPAVEDQASIPKTLEMLELRVGIETEAAALAAIRRSSAQEFEIRAAHDRMADLVAGKASASQADFEFHLSIARATNNGFYVSALLRFGLHAIPRANLPHLAFSRSETYLAQVVEEHGRIAEAISAHDPDAARAAMRSHLEGAQDRYRRLALSLRPRDPA